MTTKAIIFSFILIILLGAKYLPKPKQEKPIRLNSVTPTTILEYIDTMAVSYNIPKEVIWGVGASKVTPKNLIHFEIFAISVKMAYIRKVTKRFQHGNYTFKLTR